MPIMYLMSWFKRRRAQAAGDDQAIPPQDGSLTPEPVVSASFLAPRRRARGVAAS